MKKVTEKQWLAFDDPGGVIQAAGARATERKVRLFCVACCRHVLHLAPAGKRKTAETSLALAERYADGAGTRVERLKAQEKAGRSYSMVHATMAARCTPSDAYYAARHACDFASYGKNGVEESVTRAAQADLARDILGPLAFRPTTLEAAWLTPTVVQLAQGIYDDRAFDRLPILADALQDAGCDSDEVLGHCRGPGPHAKGCWVVDLVLGKS
jgi:hypothetical protein